MGKLIATTGEPHVFVEHFLNRFETDGHIVECFAADSGVLPNAEFLVKTPKVDELCMRRKIKSVERSHPHNHARVTGRVEIEVQIVKKLIRLAPTLILRNPNFPLLGFTPLMVFQLWGEYFHWALAVVNVKPSPNDPIGCVVIVTREPGAARGLTLPGGVSVNERYGQIGMYVGPSMTTPGAARIAVVSGGRLMILVTSNFGSASDGGGLNIYPDVEELPDTDAEPLIYGERPANPGHQADRLITKATDLENEPSERTDEYPVVGAVASAPCPDSEWSAITAGEVATAGSEVPAGPWLWDLGVTIPIQEQVPLSLVVVVMRAMRRLLLLVLDQHLTTCRPVVLLIL